MYSNNDKRSTNFTTAEDNDLLTIVSKYKHIIECKKTDSIANTQKNSTWIIIAKEYNASAATSRTLNVLKNKYKNLKKRTKEKFANEKLHVKGTGGGPSKEAHVNSINVQVMDLLGEKRMSGRVSEFDVDADLENHIPNLNSQNGLFTQQEEEAMILEMENYDCDEVQKENSDVQSTSWTAKTAMQIRTPVSTPLKTNLRGNSKVSNLLCDWVEGKTQERSLDERLKEEKHEKVLLYMKEEHDVKIRNMQEQHSRDMIMKEEQHLKDMQMKEEQHSIQVKILKRQLLILEK